MAPKADTTLTILSALKSSRADLRSLLKGSSMMIQLTPVLSDVAVKRSKKKDYYKLGMPRGCGDAEIKKAYRQEDRKSVV